MAFTSAFFDAELVGGEYDRVYSAEKFAEYFASFIANGVFPDPSTNLQVVANTVNDMNVLVSPGMGWINGYYCKNDGSYPLAVQAASGILNRIDAVVIGWSRTNREITTYIKTGTASSSPIAPSLTRNADLYELMLATITVNAGVTKVTQSMITDKRADTSVCGWVAGVVQQIDTTNLFAQYDSAFQTWFADIQAQLSGDIATNLQNQINSIKSTKTDKTYVDSQDNILGGRIDELNFIKSPGGVIVSNNKLHDLFPNIVIPCDGRNLSTIDYENLYSVLGTKYGGVYPNSLASFGSAFSSSVPTYHNLMLCPNSNKIYILSNGGNSYWSNNNGSTWISLSNIGYCTGADCNDDGTVFLKGYSSLQRTTSPEGGSWSSVSTGLSGYYYPRIRFNPTNGKFYILAGPTSSSSSNPLYLLESTDSYGTSFNQYQVLSAAGSNIDSGTLVVNGSNVLAGSQNGLRYSRDYGHTFSPVSIPVIPSEAYRSMDGSVEGVWWYYNSGNVYISKDYGATFTLLCTISGMSNTSSSIIAMDGYAIVTSNGSTSYLVTDDGAVISQTNPRSTQAWSIRRKSGVPYIGTTAGLLVANQVSPTHFAVPNISLDYGSAFIHV